MERRIERRHLAGVGTLVLVIALGVLLIFVSRTSALAAGSAQSWILNGDYAYAYWGDGWNGGYVYIAQNGNQPQGQTELLYIESWTNPCCHDEYGYGLIPNGDLNVIKGSRPMIQLNTDTCSNSNFYTSGKCGVIQINWQQDGFTYSERHAGSSTMDFGPVTWLENGTWTAMFASASGKIVDSTLVGTGGMGTNYMASITVQPK